jgi:hypothetical protein
MELYTLVSLIIGIFGGTYAALNAARTHFEGDLKKAYEESDGKIKAIEQVRGTNNKASVHVQRHKDRICNAWATWQWMNIIPGICFFLAVYAVVIWVLLDWPDITRQHTQPGELALLHAKFPWNSFRLIIGGLGTINLGCVAVAFFARSTCRKASEALQEHVDSTAMEPPKLSPPANGEGINANS